MAWGNGTSHSLGISGGGLRGIGLSYRFEVAGLSSQLSGMPYIDDTLSFYSLAAVFDKSISALGPGNLYVGLGVSLVTFSYDLDIATDLGLTKVQKKILESLIDPPDRLVRKRWAVGIGIGYRWDFWENWSFLLDVTAVAEIVTYNLFEDDPLEFGAMPNAAFYYAF